MKKLLTPAERLIVATDFTPPTEEFWLEDDPSNSNIKVICRSKREWARKHILKFVDQLSDTGVYIKLNADVRALGYDIITEVKSRGLKTCLDLKLIDLGATLSRDGQLLRSFKPRN